MNNPHEEQSQMVQRYVAGKALEGDAARRRSGPPYPPVNADGVVDPVERMNYVTDQARSKDAGQCKAPQNTSAQDWLASLLVIALCIFCMLLTALLRFVLNHG